MFVPPPPPRQSFPSPTLQLGSESFSPQKKGGALFRNSLYKVHMCYYPNNAGEGQLEAEEVF